MRTLTFEANGSTIVATVAPRFLETEWLPLWHPDVLDRLSHEQVDRIGTDARRQSARLFPAQGGAITLRFHTPKNGRARRVPGEMA